MVSRKLDAHRRVVNPRLPAFRPSLIGTPGRCVPNGQGEAVSAEVAIDPALAFEAAFAAMQADLPVIGEAGVVPGAQGRSGYSYALWEDINEAIRPILGRHSFTLRFRVSQDANRISVTAALIHQTGHREETTLALPVDLSGGKNAVQAIGSTVSYGKRYTASLLLNLTTRGEDDDGKAAGTGSLIDAGEVQQLRELLQASGRSEARFLAYLKLERLEDLPRGRFAAACETLNVRTGVAS